MPAARGTPTIRNELTRRLRSGRRTLRSRLRKRAAGVEHRHYASATRTSSRRLAREREARAASLQGRSGEVAQSLWAGRVARRVAPLRIFLGYLCNPSSKSVTHFLAQHPSFQCLRYAPGTYSDSLLALRARYIHIGDLETWVTVDGTPRRRGDNLAGYANYAQGGAANAAPSDEAHAPPRGHTGRTNM